MHTPAQPVAPLIPGERVEILTREKAWMSVTIIKPETKMVFSPISRSLQDAVRVKTMRGSDLVIAVDCIRRCVLPPIGTKLQTKQGWGEVVSHDDDRAVVNIQNGSTLISTRLTAKECDRLTQGGES